MFLRYYVVVDRPFDEVEAEVMKSADHWMPALVVKANGHGVELLSELGFEVAKRRVAKRIEVTLGWPKQAPGVTLVPIKWRAADDAALFPVLDGHLEIAKLGLNTTQLGLSANYEPPLGLMGKIADRALLHRVAEVAVKDFVEQIGARLDHKH
jgi:hypothetical protein